MKVKVLFELTYENPVSDNDKTELIETIKNHYASADIPQTENVWWKTIGDIVVKQIEEK